MAISESQLETWSHQGAGVGSRDTYATVKRALEAGGSAAYGGYGYEVFLQGSYGNDTNIYAESDVDIVICSERTFYADTSHLNETQKALYESSRIPASYFYPQYKQDVINALQTAFGSDVDSCGKAICIKPRGNRRSADVIAAFRHKRYNSFDVPNSDDALLGITFMTGSGQQIDNFPKQHSANLTAKHQSTSNRLKPMVRIFKNLRSTMVENHMIADGLAPSYFLEGLLFNVPDGEFTGTLSSQFTNVLRWLIQTTDKSKFVCANRAHWLLRDNRPTSWTDAKCQEFLNAALAFWNRG